MLASPCNRHLIDASDNLGPHLVIAQPSAPPLEPRRGAAGESLRRLLPERYRRFSAHAAATRRPFVLLSSWARQETIRAIRRAVGVA